MLKKVNGKYVKVRDIHSIKKDPYVLESEVVKWHKYLAVSDIKQHQLGSNPK